MAGLREVPACECATGARLQMFLEGESGGFVLKCEVRQQRPGGEFCSVNGATGVVLDEVLF